MSTTEKHSFQAEIQQLLNIVVHSLYTDKEIFIRELISNAADALEKLRFSQAAGQAVFQPDLPLKISIETNKDTKTISFIDTGIGMTHDELVENLGTIAHSGSKAFLKQLAEEKKADTTLIGQFGVGFYSAFMVASKVTVYTRSFHAEGSGWKWTSEGMGGYEIEPAPDLPRGTKIVLDLKEEEKQYSEDFTVERVIKQYSSFVPAVIELNGKAANTVQAIWGRRKSELKDEEYNEFYHYLSHDQSNPLYRLHYITDSPLAIQALLFVPPQNFEILGMSRMEPEVNLYCKKVLIQPKAKGLLPEWLRFLKGVVDSEDLPLNISRETMQDTTLMQKLNRALTSRFLKFLEEQAEKDPAAYKTFFEQYARFIKEGIVSDFTHREALGRLLRFESSHSPKGEQTSLADYVKRMGSDQKEIFYLLAPNREAAESSPYYEVFSSRKMEVLFLYDPWDEFVADHLRSFDGKDLQSAEKAKIDLEKPESKEGQLTQEQGEALAKWLKETLDKRVGEVRVSKRLVDSPAVAVDADPFMTASMRRIMKAMRKDQEDEARHPDLEINTAHPIIVRLESARQNNPALAVQVAEQIFDNARVAAGLLEDPRTMLKRMNELLAKVLEPKT